MEGPPQNKKGKEEKKENKTQIIIMTIIIMEEEEEEGGPFSLSFSFFLLLGRPFLFLMIKFSGCEGGEKIVIIESSHKVKRRKEKKKGD
jgi:hypothetical protein